MFYWDIMGYLGIFFALIYRIPQMIKIYRTKRGSDVSKKAFILHNGAYLSFIIYLTCGQDKTDYILLVYYFIGIIENLIILGMKKYYKSAITGNDVSPTC
jgi:uncharacterized protein with PQ loop repeat